MKVAILAFGGLGAFIGFASSYQIREVPHGPTTTTPAYRPHVKKAYRPRKQLRTLLTWAATLP
jgi:hypothetical protein